MTPASHSRTSPFRSALLLAGVVILAGSTAPSAAKRKQDEPAEPPGLASKLAKMEKKEGLLTIYLDRAEGKVWLELPQADDEGGLGTYLYVEGLLTGLGSNPVGLDRGQLGDSKIVSLRRLGNRLLFEQPNLGYRAITEDAAERAATEQSFATSVLWAGVIDSGAIGEPEVVDLTGFLVRDAHGVTRRLAETEQGDYRLDPERSAVDLDASLVFPDNVELEALLTYAGERPGSHVEETAPTPEAISLIQHHSLIRLPDDGYTPRAFDPRAASFAVGFQDYAAPLDDSIQKRWIVRHRLRKVRPGAAPSPVVEPIVYYLDRGAPEPVRSALMEGAGWWAQAFEAAGFEDAYRVELLPEGAHPLDVRYNVIQWVHRSTRGWSYGGGVIDPRTGEMIKGHVSLGSLRVRQDRLLFEGLAGTSETGTGGPGDPIELALARLRQLSAHEVGHTLGFTHNFVASTYGDRASVMDYPAPWVRPGADGGLDFSRAYGVGVGIWDRWGVLYAYGEAPEGVAESEFLEELVAEAIADGLLFLTDHDARPPGAAQPLANLWDNGSEPVGALVETLEVRRRALERFGEDNLPVGAPLALLEEVLAPLYFHHRFQLTAAAKVVGGVDYWYKVRGDALPAAAPVPADRQREGLAVLLSTVDPAVLDLPDGILELVLPRPFGYGPHRELFNGGSGPVFDPLSAAAAASDMTFAGLLQRERAARLVDQHRRNAELPGFDEVLAATTEAVFAGEGAGEDGRLAEIRRVTQSVYVRRLIGLAGDALASSAVRARAEAQLQEIAGRVAEGAAESTAARAHRDYLGRTIERFLERPAEGLGEPAPAPSLPPGDPIGQPVPGAPGCSRG